VLVSSWTERLDVLSDTLGTAVEMIERAGVSTILVAPAPKFSPDLRDRGPDAHVMRSVLLRCSLGALLLYPERCAERRSLDSDAWLDPQFASELLTSALDDRQGTLLTLDDALCPDGVCKMLDDNMWIYRDRSHISPDGSRLTESVFREAIRRQINLSRTEDPSSGGK